MASRWGGPGLPATAVMPTATQLTRPILTRFGVRTILLTGPSITGLGQVWLHTISNTGSYQVNVLGGIMLAAFGMGLTFPTISVAVTAGIGAGKRGWPAACLSPHNRSPTPSA